MTIPNINHVATIDYNYQQNIFKVHLIIFNPSLRTIKLKLLPLIITDLCNRNKFHQANLFGQLLKIIQSIKRFLKKKKSKQKSNNAIGKAYYPNSTTDYIKVITEIAYKRNDNILYLNVTYLNFY